jgi:hypothetical protein
MEMMMRTSSIGGRLGAGSVAVVAAFALAAAVSGPPSARAAQTSAPADAALAGAIDIHAHADPDSAGPYSFQAARSLDAIELARLAKARGMRGFVIKQHWDQTAQLAELVRKVVPGVEVFGGLGLNSTVGGINLAAVRHLAEVKGGWGRIVWMPTWDAEHYVRKSNQPNRPFVAISRDGDLLPDVKAVIAEMAKTRTRDSQSAMVLATGHSSPEEGLLLVREARRLGLQVVVTHPLLEIVGMSVAQMQEAAKLGAYLEFVSAFASGPQAETQTRAYAEAIRRVGPEHSIISSDFGQIGRPPHPDALAAAAKALRAHGFTERELDLMFKENPARLLGLPPR